MKLSLLLLNWASGGTEVPQCSMSSVPLFTLLPLLGWGVVHSLTCSAWASPTAFAGVSQAPLWLQGPTFLIGSHARFFHWALNCLRTGPCFLLASPVWVRYCTWEMPHACWWTEYIVSAGAHVRVACTHLPSTASSWLLGQLKLQEWNNHLRSLYRVWGPRDEHSPVSGRCMKKGTFVALCPKFGFYIKNLFIYFWLY